MIFPSIPQVTNLVFTRHSDSIPFAEHIFQIHIFTTCFTGKIQQRNPLFWKHRQSWYFFSISLWLQRGPKSKKPSSNSPPIIGLSGPKEPHHYQVRNDIFFTQFCGFHCDQIFCFSKSLLMMDECNFIRQFILVVFDHSELNSKLNHINCSFWRSFYKRLAISWQKSKNISWIKLTVESFKAHEFHA